MSEEAIGFDQLAQNENYIEFVEEGSFDYSMNDMKDRMFIENDVGRVTLGLSNILVIGDEYFGGSTMIYPSNENDIQIQVGDEMITEVGEEEIEKLYERSMTSDGLEEDYVVQRLITDNDKEVEMYYIVIDFEVKN